MLLEGTKGSIKVGATPTVVGYVSEFSVECKTETKSKGPWIGNNTKQKVRGGKESSGTLNLDIPVDTDAGHSALVAAHEAGTNIKLVLQSGDATDLGYIYTCNNAIIKSVKKTSKSEDGHSFEIQWEDADGYTLVPAT